MFVRMFMSVVDPTDLPRVKEMFREDILPVLRQQPGCEGVELVANVAPSAGGLVDGAAISRWTTLADLDAALELPEVQASITRIRDLLRQEPITKTYEVLES